MKIRLLAGLIFMAISGMLVFAQGDPALISLTVPVTSVHAGDTFALDIQVDGANGVYGGSIKLAYDPQILQVQTTDSGIVTPGDFFGGQPDFTLKNGADPDSGTVEYALTLRQPAKPVSGAGSLGSIQFLALRDGAVQVNVVEASLIAPRFEDVNGKTVATQVDKVPVQVQGLTVDVGGAAVQSAPVVELPQQNVQAPPQAPAVQLPAAHVNPPLVMSSTPGASSIIIGVLFFIVGLLLFTLSIGSYVRLRHQMAWQDSV